MDKVISFLSLWAITGYFIVPTLPKCRTKSMALVQGILGGPLFWIGVAICGLINFRRK